MTTDDRIFVRFKGRTIGPLTLADAKNLARRGQITQLHEVSADGVNWQSAKEFEQLFPVNSVVDAAAKSHKAEDLKLAPENKSVNQTNNSSSTKLDEKAVWFVHINGSNEGPMDDDQLKSLIAQGRVNRKTLIWKEGMPDWLDAATGFESGFKTAVKTKKSNSSSSDSGVESVAKEYCRARHWAMFLGVVAVVKSVFLIAGALIGIVNALGSNNAYRLIWYFLSIAYAAGVLQIGICSITFAKRLNVLFHHPNESNLLSSVRASVWYWRFSGMFTAVWISVVTIVVVVVVLVFAFMEGASKQFVDYFPW